MGVAVGMGREFGLPRMRMNRDAEPVDEPAGHAHMIEVGVGEDEGPDVLGTATDRPNGFPQFGPHPGQTGVDERQAPVALDEVAVDVSVLHQVYTRCHIGNEHDFSLGGRSPRVEPTQIRVTGQPVGASSR